MRTAIKIIPYPLWTLTDRSSNKTQIHYCASYRFYFHAKIFFNKCLGTWITRIPCQAEFTSFNFALSTRFLVVFGFRGLVEKKPSKRYQKLMNKLLSTGNGTARSTLIHNKRKVGLIFCRGEMKLMYREALRRVWSFRMLIPACSNYISLQW